MTKTKRVASSADAFNSHFSKQYGERWSALHAALLAATRYAALFNRYASETDFHDQVDKAFDHRDLQRLLLPGTSDSKAGEISAYVVDSDAGLFPPPGSSKSSLLTHWNLDAASLLPVHLLNVQPGDRLLDLCAAPGGKSVAIAQSIWPHLHAGSANAETNVGLGCLHSNEIDGNRNKRLTENLKAYLPPQLLVGDHVKVLRVDAAAGAQSLPLGIGGYDKVLVDAPCSSERHLIHAQAKAELSGRVSDEMARWSPTASKRLAKTQAELLMTALKAVRVGGKIVYATCSLSEDENDGVVEKVIAQIGKERKKGSIQWSVKLELHQDELDEWAERTKHGWIVLPDHPSGGRWGPLFFAVLVKIVE